MIHDALTQLFECFCHRQLGALVCSRCLGIYAGLTISLAVCFGFRRHMAMTKLALAIHALLIVVVGMSFLKLLPVETIAGRMLSGQVFAIGVGYFLWLGLNARPAVCARPCPGYWVAQLGGVIVLQLLMLWTSHLAGLLVDGLTAAGFVLLWIAGGRVLISLSRRNAPLPTSAVPPPATASP